MDEAARASPGHGEWPDLTSDLQTGKGRASPEACGVLGSPGKGTDPDKTGLSPRCKHPRDPSARQGAQGLRSFLPSLPHHRMQTQLPCGQKPIPGLVKCKCRLFSNANRDAQGAPKRKPRNGPQQGLEQLGGVSRDRWRQTGSAARQTDTDGRTGSVRSAGRWRRCGPDQRAQGTVTKRPAESPVTTVSTCRATPGDQRLLSRAVH